MAGLQPQYSLRSEGKPLLWAALISLTVHAFAFWLLVVVAVASVLFNSSKRSTIADLKRLQESRPQSQEPQLVFVQVDPTQPATEAPKNPKFYSSQNSIAANPDAKVETGVPKIDGTQTHVPDTADPGRPKPFPLQPAPPKEPTPPEPPVETKPKSSPPPGDLAMLNPSTKPDVAKEKTDAAVTPTPAPTPRPRPLTLAEAAERKGQKLKEDGGVAKRRGTASFDVVGSQFGEYDARFIAAVEQRWYDLLDSHQFTQESGGKVVVEFRLDHKGGITNLRVVQTDVGQLLTYLCQSAILDPAPYEAWPQDMRRKIAMESGGDYRDVQFTFYYEW